MSLQCAHWRLVMPMAPIDPSADAALPAPPARWGAAPVSVAHGLGGALAVQVARLRAGSPSIGRGVRR